MDVFILVISLLMIVGGARFWADSKNSQTSFGVALLGIAGIMWISISAMYSKEKILNSYTVRTDESKTFQYIMFTDGGLKNTTAYFGMFFPEGTKVELVDCNGWSCGMYRILSRQFLRVKTLGNQDGKQ